MKTALTILIVEDEPDVRSMVRASVEHAARSLDLDVRIVEAGSAYDAVHSQRQSSVDAVFLDYDLRGGENGCAAISRMRDPFGRLFVVLVSGAPEKELGKPLIDLQERLKLRFEFAPKPLSDLKLHSLVMKCRDLSLSRPMLHPLAVAVQSAHQGSNPTLQLQGMERAFELILKLTVFLAAAELLQRDVRVFEAADAGFAQMLTLGPWLTLADRLARAHRELDGERVVSDLHTNVKGRSGISNVVRSFKPVRDDEIHHGLPTDDLGHEGRVEEFRARFDTLIRSLGYLRDVVWAASENVEMLPGGEFRHSLVVFMGESDRFERVKLLSRDHLSKRRVYVFDGRLRPLPMYPFVLWRHCPECHRGRLFLLDNFHDGQFTHKDASNCVVIDAEANAALLDANARLTLTAEAVTTAPPICDAAE